MVRTGLEQESLEDAIARVKGVYSCQVVINGREVQEIHAIGAAERSAKQIVRDIETLLRVRFGLAIDYRKISLVQLDQERAHRVYERPRIRSVEGANIASGFRIAVNVEQHGKTYVGQAEGGPGLVDRLQLAAKATLASITEMMGDSEVLALGDACLVPLAGREAVTAVVSVRFPTGEEVLCGSSLVQIQDDLLSALQDAAARAVLDALNRRLPIILSLLTT